MGSFVEHPVTLVFALVCCSPALLPLARFCFDDFETFKAEAGLDYDHNRLLWILGWPRVSWRLHLKLLAFVSAFAALVTAVYLTICRVLY